LNKSGTFWRCSKIAKNNKKNNLRINDEITGTEVRLVGKSGEMIGIVELKKALLIAENEGLDLVEISPKAKPPVCKIIDYGKYLFELAKKKKEANKHQKVMVVKEVWLKPKIEDHDLNFKVKNACKFLGQGNKVKVSLRFRGREMSYTAMGMNVINKFASLCSEFGEPDRRPKLEGRNITMVLSPSKK